MAIDQLPLQPGQPAQLTTLNLTFRPMTLSDLSSVMVIERQSFSTPWSENTFRRSIDRKRTYSHCLVAVCEEIVIAYAHFVLISGDVHITNLAVAKTHRRLGVGKHLLKELLLQAREMKGELCFLEVRVSNIAAYSLYQQFGFQVHSIREKYYTDNGEDAYLLWIPNLSVLKLP